MQSAHTWVHVAGGRIRPHHCGDLATVEAGGGGQQALRRVVKREPLGVAPPGWMVGGGTAGCGMRQQELRLGLALEPLRIAPPVIKPLQGGSW